MQCIPYAEPTHQKDGLRLNPSDELGNDGGSKKKTVMKEPTERTMNGSTDGWMDECLVFLLPGRLHA